MPSCLVPPGALSGTLGFSAEGEGGREDRDGDSGFLLRQTRPALCGPRAEPARLAFLIPVYVKSMQYCCPTCIHFYLDIKKLVKEKGRGGEDGFPGGSDGKESACNARDLGSVPGLRRSPGEGNGYSLQYSCLENSMDRGV